MTSKPSLFCTLSRVLLPAVATLVSYISAFVVPVHAIELPPRQITNETLNESVSGSFFRVSDDGEYVVFLSSQEFAQELFSVPTNEGSVVRLNPDLVDSGDVTILSAVSRPVSPFRISPDSERVVYIADQRSNGLFELFSVPIGGGDAVRISGDLPGGGDVGATGRTTDFQISSDSQRVVYLADQNVDGQRELFSVPITGGTAIRLNAELTISGSDVIDFLISPDGQQVLYLADQNNNDSFELFRVAITGGPAERLNGDLAGDVEEFQISPDGQHVVYRADQEEIFDIELYRVAITGGPETRLNGDLVVAGLAGASEVVGFKISADSSRVVYRADQDTDNVFELYSVPILGGAAVRLNEDLIGGGDVAAEFDISADSQTVLYIADQMFDNDFDLFGVPITGGAATQINPANSNVASGSSTIALPDNAFAVSPDGQQVVFLVGFSRGSGELFSAPIAGGTPVALDAVDPGDIGESFQINPDSQTVVFSPESTTQDLFRIAIAGGEAEQINGDLPFAGRVTRVVFSSDGQRIVYSSNESDSGRLNLFSFGDFSAPAAAVLPGSRSVLVGTNATAFATFINTNAETLQNCSISPPAGLDVQFFYQTTDPATNAAIGTVNTPASIAPGGVQSFIFGLTPNSEISPTDVALNFDCSNSIAAAVFEGVNTILLSGSASPVADIVALGATPLGDGILSIPGTSGSAAFAVASVNVGSAATVTATVDTGSATPPLSLFICETNPSDGQCLAPPSPTVQTSVAVNATPTFSVFATASGDVTFDPANTRIRVRFLEAGVVRGTTSVAVRTQ